MINRAKNFEIISFTAAKRQYFPASMDWEDWMPETYVKHTEVEIALGQSRYGGPVIDLPKGIGHPKNMRFAAQLDLSRFSPFDKTGLLPKSGQLIFFSNIRSTKGQVIYADVPNESLERTVVEHKDDFFIGVLIDKIFSDTESLDERFREPHNAGEIASSSEQGKVWDSFSGSEKSKIFGIYTNCQYDQRDIEAVTFSNELLLLQIGTNGFNDEGVFSVLIDKQDLIERNFRGCKFVWGQT